jgi:hypothetical protein
VLLSLRILLQVALRARNGVAPIPADIQYDESFHAGKISKIMKRKRIGSYILLYDNFVWDGRETRLV